MKKILCFTLAFLIAFNAITCNVFAESFSGSSTDYENPTDAKPITDSPEYKEVQKNINTIMKMFFTAYRPDHASELWSDEISNYVESDSIKDNNVTTDGNYYYINANFIKNINQKMQENIHALDGYYLIQPSYPFTFDGISMIYNDGRDFNRWSDEYKQNFNSFASSYSSGFIKRASLDSNSYYVNAVKASSYLYIDEGKLVQVNASGEVEKIDYLSFSQYSFSLSRLTQKDSFCFSLDDLLNSVYNQRFSVFPLGSPVKIFYSKQDYTNYLNQGRQYYAPNLPFSNIRIPVTYINNINNSDLPDFDFNLGSLVGKAEADVQGEIDLALKNYLDHLVDLNNNNKPAPTTAPTPTKAPTSTPTPVKPVTPTPVLPNVTVTPTPPPEDFSSINKWLEQIYNWLLDFGDKHETFTEKICEYIDSTDGKLDQIIEAIDKLSQGNTEGEINGCKYDYTALSEFMTKLWNESDKKFDKMIELLEENNEYQQKIVDSLNQIKALLVADTVLDVFRNRSNETANKAKEKFPTSLPWDIALVVNAFSATPKEPVIELPIKIDSMNIDEKIVVDLSSEEWVKLAKTCRYLLSILFVLYMVHLSRKFFSKGDE